MEENKKKNYFPIAACVLFALAMFIVLFKSFGRSNAYYDRYFPEIAKKVTCLGIFSFLLTALGGVAVAFALVTNRRDVVIPAGFVDMAAGSLLAVFSVDFPINIVMFLMFLLYLAEAFIAAIYMTNSIKNEKAISMVKEKENLLCLVPALIVVGHIVEWLYFIIDYWPHSFMFRSFAMVLLSIGVFLTHWCIISPDNPAAVFYKIFGTPEERARKREDELKRAANSSGNSVPASDLYRSIPKMIFFTIITLGIYMYVWIYRVTRITNSVEGETPRSPAKKLLLCMFIPGYAIFWIYKTAIRLNKMAATAGLSSQLMIFFAVFAPKLGFIIIQDKLNEIAIADVRNEEQSAKSAPAEEQAADRVEEQVPENDETSAHVSHRRSQTISED